MEAQTKQPQAAPALNLTPEAVASALAVLGEVAKGLFSSPPPAADPLPLQPQSGSTPAQILTPTADRIETYAATLGRQFTPALSEVREPLLTSSRLWTLVGTVAGLAVQHPIGLELPPITQVCIAGVAGIYIAARSLKGGR